MASDHRRRDVMAPFPPPAAGLSPFPPPAVGLAPFLPQAVGLASIPPQAARLASIPPPAASESTVDTRASEHDLPPPPRSSSACPPRSSSSDAPAQVLRKKKSSKKFTSPVVTMAVKSPGIRIMLSPRLKSPVAATRTSSTPTPPPPNTNNKRPTSSRSSQKSKRRKLKSEIWTDFEPIYDGETLAEAQCIHCNKIFKVTRAVGTSACLRHLASCNGKGRLNQMIDQMNSANSSEVSLKDWKFDPDFARGELLKLIVLHGLPFSIVEYPKFRSFVASLNPWFPPISRTTIRSDCIASFEKAKASLREGLSKAEFRVSLTADLWTSNQSLGYLCVTCHYIDVEWKLYKRIIKFALVETPHDGKTLFNAMLKTLCDWNIEDMVFSVTLDNASVNDTFVKALRDNLVSKGLLFRKGKLFHSRCAAHVLNLIVQEGFGAISSAVKNIRESVKYIKSSQARKERFEKVIKQVGISLKKRPSLDVVTRWNSTYHMLDSAYLYKRAFESLSTEDSQYVNEPLEEEWKLSKKLCDILETFCNATKMVSGSNYPTSSCYFHQIWEVKKLLELESSNSDCNIALMVRKMKEKLQKYWDLSYLQICIPVILDPRFKLAFIKFRLQQGFGDKAFLYLSKIEKAVRKLFDEYRVRFSDLSAECAISVNEELDVEDPWADWGMHQNLQQRIKLSELDLYLEEELVAVGVNLDILQYWKAFTPKYPILARLARDVLAVPASTVASESAFSSAEKTISDYRSRLASNTVEALICLQDWIRGNDSTLDDIAGNVIGDDDDGDSDVTEEFGISSEVSKRMA